MQILSRLDAITWTLNQIKSENAALRQENAILRNEILGVGNSAPSSSQTIPGCKTLRQMVEETQLHVKALNDKIMNYDKQNKRRNSKSLSPAKNINNDDSCNDESYEESEDEHLYSTVEIRSKTRDDEWNWMKTKLIELLKTERIVEAQPISSLIPFSIPMETSVTMKLSNYLDSSLTDPQYYFLKGSNQTSPSSVAAHVSQIFSFAGDSTRCSVLCSFSINTRLRLVIYSNSQHNGYVSFGIGFVPAELHTNENLYHSMESWRTRPDVRLRALPQGNYWGVPEPIELFVNNMNLLARGHITIGPRAVVHVEIIEIRNKLPRGMKPEFRKVKKIRLDENQGEVSCRVEIVNGCSVKLEKPKQYVNFAKNIDPIPPEVNPMQHTLFMVAVNTKLEAMFSYQIATTDLAFVIALNVQAGGNNCFSAAFYRLPVTCHKEEFVTLMKSVEWNTRPDRRRANAKEGIQLMQIRNIRAEIRMTEGVRALLKIRIFIV